ncbi:RodZ domain-containing protein [Halopseudomonas salina]|uniref:Cro/Cl family transcriptional regulator n=1 Tax=Halopseudomonas salina TaxID=1323744 RepID=A0ABQ1PVZ3_9GAMM|nr:RodZ family helix-turn-helix domain-containing protein [Halopseudomonas salina]GGD05502.1 Cro/Cl family transcriptional regulator [Halopseudomonas salina]
MSTEQRDAMPPNGEFRPDDGRMAHPGATLQAAREAKGLSTAEAATSLRLPEKILVHLEAGRFDQLPGDTFARGYVRSYARLLGLDANRLVLEYDRSRGIEVRERQVSGIDKMTKPGKAGGMLVTWTTVIVALAILASILLWWYDSQPTRSVEDVSSIAGQALDEVEVDALALPENFASEPSPPGEAAMSVPDPVTSVTDAEGPADATGNLAVPDDGTMSDGAAEIPVEEPQAALDQVEQPQPTAVVEQEPVVESQEQPAVAGSGLQMQFTGDCWVQVRTPGGDSLHSGLMQAGQSLSIDHQGPIEVVIGAVEAVSTIAFNGEPVDTQSVRESGVVRLRLG